MALDGLSGWFLLLIGAVMLATCAPCLGQVGLSRARLVPIPAFALGATFAMIAADAFALLLGFGVALGSAWFVTTSENTRDGAFHARRRLLLALGAGACLLLAFAVRGSEDASFAALRAAPPEGWRAALWPVLAVAGVITVALAPPNGPAAPDASPPATLLAVAALPKLALYVAARLMLDLGAVATIWWAVPLVALGAAWFLREALRSVLAQDTRALLAASARAHAGLLLLAMGLVPLFRAADLGALASLAGAALLLHALSRALLESLLFLLAATVERAAGSGSLDALGGLIRPMPRVALCAAGALLGAATVPPGFGFASAWLVLQSLLGAWRTADPVVQLVATGALAVVAFALVTGTAAAVRWFGLVFLGRPRGPRAAGAADASGPTLVTLAVLGGLVPFLGVLPGSLLKLADPALRVLAGGAMEERAGVFALSVGDGLGSYLPIEAALLLAGCAALAFMAARVVGPRTYVRVPAWNGGGDPPPAHLPFGDPVAQPSAAGLAQPLRHALGFPAVPRDGAGESVVVPLSLSRRLEALRAFKASWAGAAHRRDVGAALALLLLALLIFAGARL